MKMSTVLKAGARGQVLKRLATVDLADHLREARTVIEEAHRRAAEHIARTQEESKRAAENAHQAAREEGRQKGFQEGMEAGRQQALSQAVECFNREHAHVVADFQGAVAQFDAMKEQLALVAMRDLLEFAVSLACKLTFAIGSLHPEAVIENVKRAIECVGQTTDLVIRLHPSEVATMETIAAPALKQIEASRTVRIHADESIAPGGCVLQTDRMEVDARLETQADEIVELLLGQERGHG